MRDPSLTESLCKEPISRSTCSDRKVLAVFSLSIGLSLTVLLALALGTHGRDAKRIVFRGPSITMSSSPPVFTTLDYDSNDRTQPEPPKETPKDVPRPDDSDVWTKVKMDRTVISDATKVPDATKAKTDRTVISKDDDMLDKRSTFEKIKDMVPEELRGQLAVACMQAQAGQLPPQAMELLEKMEKSKTDHEWNMKRDWSDHDFMDGHEANMARLQEFEEKLVKRVHTSCKKTIKELGPGARPDLIEIEDGSAGGSTKDSKEDCNVLARAMDKTMMSLSKEQALEVKEKVLDDATVIGSALDIIVAYLKCYEIDKASAVIDTVLPTARKRGGMWLLKALNHVACVRSKQGRSADALAALNEMEKIVGDMQSTEQRDEAWQWWETVYRNFAWTFQALGHQDQAITYTEGCIAVKERVGKNASWFDYWDLARFKATKALKDMDKVVIGDAIPVVQKALKLHDQENPKDVVMSGKIWHTLAELSFALGFIHDPDGITLSHSRNFRAKSYFDEALHCFNESHKRQGFAKGAHNHLTGSAAEGVSWALMKLGRDEEAKPYLLDSFEAASKQQNAWGDGEEYSDSSAMHMAMATATRVLEVHRRTGDAAGLEKYTDAAERLAKNCHSRLALTKDSPEAATYERLIQSCSAILGASGKELGIAKGQRILEKYSMAGLALPSSDKK
eukprot:gnl/MRDRNA2_/MRDRNA2_150794_c0_seq1.p1 gnl/MRDRNA2_/MRDRNA2_150794_c0~~gnl/MRDRNA2_/MRDRNA2_150794_c0_seq1.p1  ORF type:complete len:678 (+),score=151.93 gnl/MRDRNA2_/MRDRNA2_150794_c0_seq1:110-2143(+)